MFREDGEIFFETKEEGERYVEEMNAPLIEARNKYFQALYKYVDGDSRKFLSYIEENTPDELESAHRWFIEKLRSTILPSFEINKKRSD